MENLNKKIVDKLIEKNKTISFMESCTGGYLANEITNISGSSNVIKVSLVTYSNEFKEKFGVSKNIIDKYTVYSNQTAKDMAKNVAIFANASYGIGITGELSNINEADNKVYYSIYDYKNKKNTSNMLMIKPDERCKMKKLISNCVMEELWNILMKN